MPIQVIKVLKVEVGPFDHLSNGYFQFSINIDRIQLDVFECLTPCKSYKYIVQYTQQLSTTCKSLFHTSAAACVVALIQPNLTKCYQSFQANAQKWHLLFFSFFFRRMKDAACVRSGLGSTIHQFRNYLFIIIIIIICIYCRGERTSVSTPYAYITGISSSSVLHEECMLLMLNCR